MKRVVITGASRGIGRASALAFANAGYFVHALGRESESMTELMRELSPARGEFVRCELRQPKSVAESAMRILESGTPEVVVHSAGVVMRAPLEAMTDDVWDEQLEVNVSAPFRLTRALLPRMLEAGRGRILFVTSISATLGSPGQSAYNASKAAETALMRCLAEELASTPLFTAAVAPGAVSTDMLNGSPWPARMNAEEVAKTLLFLGDAATRAHNGSVLEMFGV